jgi:hypothetical protein
MKLSMIKKIEFNYSNFMHCALVSINGTSDDMFVHIQLINSFLCKIFAVEHIRFSTRNGEIKLQEVKHPFVYQIAQQVHLKLCEEFQNTDAITLRAV